MPTYTITDPQNGRKVRITGDSPPTEAEINQIFAAQVSKPAKPVQAKTVAPKPVQPNPVNPLAQFAGERLKGKTEFYQALGHHLGNVPLAIGQVVANVAGMLPSQALKDNADTYNQFVQQREKQYQSDVPDSASSYAGAVVGEALPWLTPAGVGGMNTVAKVGGIIPKTTGILRAPASVARIAVGGAAQGAVAGALTTDTSGDFSNKGQQIGLGAFTGGALPLALYGGAKSIDAVKGAYDYVANPEKIAGRKLAEWYGKDEATINALRNAEQYFPDEQVTSAQALNSNRALAVEKAMGNSPESKIVAAEMRDVNNRGRVAVAQDIAKTPDEMALLKGDRNAVTKPYYDEFVDPKSKWTRYNTAANAIAGIKGRMSGADFEALKKAKTIINSVRDGRRDEAEAAQELAQLTFGSKTAQKAIEQATASMNKNMVNPNRIIKQLKEMATSENTTVRQFANSQLETISLKADANGFVPVKTLQKVEQGLGREFSRTAIKEGGDKSGLVELAPLKRKLVNTLERSAPGYRQNSQNYAVMSSPINDARAGDALLAQRSRHVENGSGELPITLADVNKVINAEGKAQFPMSPMTQQKVAGLQKSLQREGRKLPFSGSDTDYNLNADGWLARQMFGGGKGRSALQAMVLPGVGAAMGGIGGAIAGGGLSGALITQSGKINSRIASEAGKGIYNSRVAADMIEKTLRDNPKQAQDLLKRFPYWRKLISQ